MNKIPRSLELGAWSLELGAWSLEDTSQRRKNSGQRYQDTDEMSQKGHTITSKLHPGMLPATYAITESESLLIANVPTPFKSSREEKQSKLPVAQPNQLLKNMPRSAGNYQKEEVLKPLCTTKNV